MSRTLDGILKDARYFGTWDDNDGKNKINNLERELLEYYPDNIEDFNKTVSLSRQAGQIVQSCSNLGSGKESKTAKKLSQEHKIDLKKIDLTELLEKQKEALIELGFEDLCSKAETQFERGKKAAERFQKEYTRSKKGKKPRTVLPPHEKKQSQCENLIQNPILQKRTSPSQQNDLHPNDIRSLNPRPKWTLLLDETGSDFGFTAQSRSDQKKEMGRMVGLLLPDIDCLPKLSPGWHAVDIDDPEEIDTVLQNILNAECGVFGLSVKSLHLTPGQRWAQLAQAVIEWVVRLVPLDNATSIEVLVEQRGEYTGNQNWQLMTDVIKRSLASTWPERARNIELEIKTITKSGHVANGYVDAVAFTWAQSTPWSIDRLRDSGLNGTCLLSVDANLLLNNWNAFLVGGDLDADSWSKLVSSDDARSVSIVTSLLESLGEECRANPELWDRYLQFTKQHATGKAVTLPQLARQIDWLEGFKPVSKSIPTQLRLVWLTVKLANANHHGETEISWMKELESLSEQLYLEDAPMVCHADLHRAVQETNRFAFELASEPLQRWEKCDPAVPGLRYWGQVQSSLGQHSAFLGKTDEAVAYFDKALEAFKKLSDGGAAECKQTGTYKVIVMMDNDKFNDDSVVAALNSLSGDTDLDHDVVRGNAAKEKYIHHLLLRLLVNRNNPALQKNYLSQQDEWQSGQGHPWPLIQAYRAILLYPDDKPKAVETMIDGAILAFEARQGPTVQLIGACLRSIAHVWGEPWPEAEDVLNELSTLLPHAQDRIEIIKEYIAQLSDERKLLEEVLPFNFR